MVGVAVAVAVAVGVGVGVGVVMSETTTAGILSPDEYAAQVTFDLLVTDMDRERSRQADDRILGVSDIGKCHEQARRMWLGLPDSDSPSRFAAMLGTWVDAGWKEARAHPSRVHDATVTVTLPNGVTLTGHPDEVDEVEPSVSDLKSVNYDGLARIRRNHSEDRHRYQRHLYGLGVIQDVRWPHITADNLVVRNVYLDRSGKDAELHVEQEMFSMDVVREASEWLGDVLYAVEHKEEASKDPWVGWCRSYCAHATACRGMDMPSERISEPELAAAVRDYHDADKQGKEAERIRKAAKEVIVSSKITHGVSDTHVARVTWVNPTEKRQGYWTIDTEEL